MPRHADNSATTPFTHQKADPKATSAMSDPGTILKVRPPPQFCRYEAGSSVGNPSCPRGDLNSEDTGVTGIRRAARIAAMACIPGLPGPLRPEIGYIPDHARRYRAGYLAATILSRRVSNSPLRQRAAACARTLRRP